jgi:hypothetical protein
VHGEGGEQGRAWACARAVLAADVTVARAERARPAGVASDGRHGGRRGHAMHALGARMRGPCVRARGKRWPWLGSEAGGGVARAERRSGAEEGRREGRRREEGKEKKR